MQRRSLVVLGLMLVVAAIALFWPRVPDQDASESLLESGESASTYEGPAHDAIFLILIDTLRADRFSCYGYREHQTPHADRLAAEGLRFDSAQSVASWTRSSVASIFTSLYPTQVGLVERPGPEGKQWKWREPRKQLSSTLPQDETTLAELLRDAGFATCAFVNQPALNHQRGLQQGFDEWYYPRSADEVVLLDPEAKFMAQGWLSLQYADRADALLMESFESWLAERPPGEKVFGYLHLLTPHLPYVPKAPFVPQPEGREPTESELYDGEVLMADAMLGRILEIIREYRGEQNTLIVFSSDHGEEFKDHGLLEHGHSLHHEVIRVPLIVSSPRLPAGKVVQAPVRTIDLMPSILELAQVDASGLMGRSLHPLMVGQELRLPVYSEAMLYGSTERSLIEDGFKLMYDEQGASWRLFDLTADPLENSDLADEQPQRLEAMRARMQRAHRELSEDYIDRLGRYETHLSPEERAREEERARQALKALGYID